MSETILELHGIYKSFDGTPVLKGIGLQVERGEFITLLGSSGCGKTTTLRIIAGLETPDAGRVVLRGKDVTAAPPEKRDVNTVFQNYALFPHMSVAANIGYSLRLKKMPRAEIAKEVDAALELVQLLDAGDVVNGVVDVWPHRREERRVPLRPQAINRLLGTQLSREEMVAILLPLGFEMDGDDVIVPSSRCRARLRPGRRGGPLCGL